MYIIEYLQGHVEGMYKVVSNKQLERKTWFGKGTLTVKLC